MYDEFSNMLENNKIKIGFLSKSLRWLYTDILKIKIRVSHIRTPCIMCPCRNNDRRLSDETRDENDAQYRIRCTASISFCILLYAWTACNKMIPNYTKTAAAHLCA